MEIEYKPVAGVQSSCEAGAKLQATEEFLALARISHGARCGLGTPISRLAYCKSPIGRLAFPGFKPCSACQVCVAIGRRSQSNHHDWTAFPGVGPAPSWRTCEKCGLEYRNTDMLLHSAHKLLQVRVELRLGSR